MKRFWEFLSHRRHLSEDRCEELLVAALSSCHMLSYLHLCADAGIVVTEYEDEARGQMVETKDTGGHFTQVTLYPRVKITSGDHAQLALQLHEKAHHLCFIANSVNFPVLCEASIEVSPLEKAMS